MYIIAEYSTRNNKNDFSSVEFKDKDDKIYKLKENIFLFNFTNLNRKFKDLFDVINKNPSFVKYILEVDDNNAIKKIYEMPLLPEYLNKFYIENPEGENYSLLVNKFGRFKENKLEYMDNSGRGLFCMYEPDTDLIEKIHLQIDNKKQILIKQLQTVYDNTLQMNWRMTLGLGNASAYNNGFTFHPVYGISYIPGQYLKSLIRKYIINRYYINTEILSNDIKKDDKISDKQEFLAEQDPGFCYIFGCSENSYDGKARKGFVDFMDAFPSSNLKIEPDIMNPHYVEYYKGKGGMPHDSGKLTPIIFLTVKDSDFRFLFYIKNNANTELKHYKYKYDEILVKERFENQQFPGISDLFLKGGKISDLLSKIFNEAMKDDGIGAKTNVGYGRFF